MSPPKKLALAALVGALVLGLVWLATEPSVRGPTPPRGGQGEVLLPAESPAEPAPATRPHPSLRAVEPTEARREAPVDVPLTVAVRGPSGVALDGAQVVLFRGERVLANERTDAAGEIVLEPLEGVVDAGVWHRSILPYHATLDASPGRRVIRLPEGAAVAGRVLLEGLPPDPPIRLWLHTDPGVQRGMLPPFVWKAAQRSTGTSSALGAETDPAGAFRFSGLPGNWRGQVTWPEPDCPIHGNLQLGRPRADLEILLTRGPRVMGRIVEKPGGAAVADLEFRVIALEHLDGIDQNAASMLADTDEDGRFEVGLCDFPNAVLLTLEPPGGGGARQVAFERPAGVGSVWDLGEISLVEDLVLEVFALDAEGLPLPRALARVIRPNRGPPFHPVVALTDAGGRATVAIPPDTEEVRVVKPGYATAGFDPFSVRSLPVVVVLEPACVLEIDLGVPDERPRRVATVALWSKEPLFADTESWRPEDLGLLRAGFNDAQRTEAGLLEEGGYTALLRPVDDRYRVSGIRPFLAFELGIFDSMGFMVHAEPIEPLRPGEHRTLRIEIPPASHRLHGRVENQWGGPVRNATLWIKPVQRKGPGIPTRSFNRLTGRTGQFSIPVASPRLRVTVRAGGYTPLFIADLALPVDGGPVRFVLERGVKGRLRVVDREGRPVAGCKGVHAFTERTPSIPGKTVEPGVFAFGVLPTGLVTFSATVGGRRFETLHDTADPVATLVVDQAGSVRVEVRPAPQRDGSREHFVVLLSPQLEHGRLAERLPESAGGALEVLFPTVFPGAYEVLLESRDPQGDAPPTVLAGPIPVDVQLGPPAQVLLEP